MHDVFFWLWAGTAVLICDDSNNPISLPIDMKVSVYGIPSVLFGSRAVYVFSAGWVIAFWVCASVISRHSCSDGLQLCSDHHTVPDCNVWIVGELWMTSAAWMWLNSELPLWTSLWNTLSSQEPPQPPATTRGRPMTDSPTPQRFQNSICICLHRAVMMRSRTLRQRRWGMSSCWWCRGRGGFASHRRAAICIFFMNCSLDSIFHVTSVVFTLFPKPGTEFQTRSLKWCQLEGGETKNIFSSNYNNCSACKGMPTGSKRIESCETSVQRLTETQGCNGGGWTQ